MAKKYQVVIEFEVPDGISDEELAEVADSMSVQYESLNDGDIVFKSGAILTSVNYKEVA